MVVPALEQGGYAFRTQVCVGQRLGIGRHVIDAVVTKGGESILVSVKWQQIRGTAEQKVPFELICLAELLQTGPISALTWFWAEKAGRCGSSTRAAAFDGSSPLRSESRS
jgi:hypothetical protein